MNQSELARDIAARNGISVAQAHRNLAMVADSMVRAVVAGEKVSVTGFVIIEQVERAERMGRNPQENSRIVVPATTGIRVRAAQGFKDLVSGARELPADGTPAHTKARSGRHAKPADATS